VSQLPEQLHQAVSVETLKRFLTVRGEGDEWDFKERLDTESKLARAELARDALAFGNTPGGGTLILGVTKDYQHVGLERDAEVDTTRVRQAIERYIDGNFLVVAASHRFTPANEDEEKIFGLIYVSRGAAHPLLAACDAPPPPRGELLFKAGDIFVRRGAQSIRANTGDIRRLLAGTVFEQERIAAANELWACVLEQHKQAAGLEFLSGILLVTEYESALTDPHLRATLFGLTREDHALALSDLQNRVILRRPHLDDRLYEMYRRYSAIVGRITMKMIENRDADRLLPWDAGRDGSENDQPLLALLSAALPADVVAHLRFGFQPMKPVGPLLDALEGEIVGELRGFLIGL